MLRISIICAVLACLGSRAGAQEPVRLADVPWYEAETYVDHWVAPGYFPLAKVVRVEGAVTVYARVSPEGSVEAVFWTGDIPLLADVAVDAVRQWRFHPIVVEGRPTAARLAVLVRFYPTESPKVRPAVFALLERARECRGLLDRHQYGEAEATCLSLGGLAREVPPGRFNERLLAYMLLGEMLSARGRSKEALDVLKAAIKPVDPFDPTWGGNEDVAAAYRATGRAYLATGDIKRATHYFKSAEGSLTALHKAIRGQRPPLAAALQLRSELADRCGRMLQGALGELVACLRQAGRADDARKAEARLNRLLAGPSDK